MSVNFVTSLSVNVPQPLVESLDRHVDAHAPFVKRHAVQLAALLIGLAALDQDAGQLKAALMAVEDLRKQPST